LLRSGKPFPLTVRDLLAAIDALAGSGEALPDQLVSLVADGGHVPWTPETDLLQRAFRFAIARGRGEFSLLISASTALDPPPMGPFCRSSDGTRRITYSISMSACAAPSSGPACLGMR
jgi:hypothetical protein